MREATVATETFWILPSPNFKSIDLGLSFVTLPARVVPSFNMMVSMPKPATILAEGSTIDSTISSFVRSAQLY